MSTLIAANGGAATRAESQQRRFQLQECAQQLIRMHNASATFAMSVNNPPRQPRFVTALQ